jgi:predicted RNase H-like HicB family nuclease
MMDRPSYTARCIRSGDWWAIQIPDVDGVWTQARRLDQVEHMARDAVAAMLDVPPDSFDLDVVPELPDRDAKLILEATELRDELEDARRRAMQATVQAIVSLRQDLDLPLRDIGTLLGLSHQRVAQILPEIGHEAIVDKRMRRLLSR